MQTPPIRAPELFMKAAAGASDPRPGFKENLVSSINEVNDLQHNAHNSMEEIATGKSNNLHETMIAIQKAEISFKMMMQVRNKIMDAYQEIMRMQV